MEEEKEEEGEAEGRRERAPTMEEIDSVLMQFRRDAEVRKEEEEEEEEEEERGREGKERVIYIVHVEAEIFNEIHSPFLIF